MKLLSTLVLALPCVYAYVLLPLKEQPQVTLDSGEYHFNRDELRMLEEMDVVDAMHLTGNGEGLEKERIVQITGENEIMRVTEGDKLRLKKAGYHFMDITDHLSLGSTKGDRLSVSAVDFPKKVEAKDSVKAYFEGLNESHLRADIARFTAFYNRNYNAKFGLQSSLWLYDQVESIILANPNPKTILSIQKINHKFLQKSVIARIESSNSTVAPTAKSTIILGAHQDSLNYKTPFFMAPGADDDGSGTVTTLQVFRTLIEKAYIPPAGIALEFQWYAAEEGGLLGSQDIAASYEMFSRNVKAMLQFDMTAFIKAGTTPKIAFFTSEISKPLTSYLKEVVGAYLPHLPVADTTCGNRCGSDHMSWNKAGFESAFVFEGLFEDSPDVLHTMDDRVDFYGDQYSFEHMLDFAKLGIAYMIETAEL